MNPATKPRTPTDNLCRVVRGGSPLGVAASFVRAAYRYDNTPSIRYISVGFRCALRGRAPR